MRPYRFVRISHSEIVNFDKVKKLDLSYNGSIVLSLSDGSITYASRRYMRHIRDYLGI